jgi:hypothetical protein
MRYEPTTTSACGGVHLGASVVRANAPSRRKRGATRRLSFTPLAQPTFLAVAVGSVTMQAQRIFACGSLVAPDEDTPLARITTGVAWQDEIERFITGVAYEA